MRNQTCCFTGHRNIPVELRSTIAEILKKTIISSIEQGYLYFGAGGALGFDTLAAQTVLDLKCLYPSIKLILVLPCRDQASRWTTDDKTEYEEIKDKADKIVYTSEHYYRGCMHKRNRHLVECSSLCICYLTEDSGGTAYTVEYALSQGLKVINIAKKISAKRR